MDAMRRLAAGDLAEVVGAAGLESDAEARRLRLRRIAQQSVAQLTAADRIPFAAYARGVNHFIETHRGRLPLEFALLRYEPRPWTITDSILIGLHMYRTLTTSWRTELLKQTMLSSGEPAKVNTLFPARGGGEEQPGSNAWALAGSRTASRRPILANDPHLEYSLPSVWFLIHLQAPGLNVSGAALPGVPCILIGHNDRIAWGFTNLQFDVQDLYAERLDPRTGQYLFRGKPLQARNEQELIPVRNSKPVAINNWVTHHGPVMVSSEGRALTMAWAGAQAEFRFPFLDLNRAHNWQEFTAALSRHPGPAQNVIYADVDGNIGYHVAGALPIRRNHNGDVPADGSTGEFDWQGWIPYDQLPSVYNPPSGMIITANQNPFPADYPYRVNGNFAPRYRSGQIKALLSRRKDWKPAEMLAVQKDVYSPFSHFLARQVLAAYEGRKGTNPALTEAIEMLRNWNGQMDKDQGAPFLISLVYQHVRRAIGDRASGGKSAGYEFALAPAVIEKLLRERPAGWFDDYDMFLLRALLDAVEEGQRMQSRNLGKWRYGVYNELRLGQPVAGRAPWIGPYFNIGPAPQSGSSTTVKQTTQRLGPSMRMIVDLGNLDGSFQNIPVGQSGHRLSRHYNDQWPSYYVGNSFPMQFSRIDAKSVLNVRPAR
jgi:penicillin amidase